MTRRRRGGKRNSRVSPQRALADLNLAISATEEHKAARREVLMRFARVVNGAPVLCHPPRRELLMDRVPGAFKVIYDTEDNARDAASELARLGSPPQEPYRCNWGSHFHTRTLEKYADEKKRA